MKQEDPSKDEMLNKIKEQDKAFRAFWIDYVGKGRDQTGLTIEDEINISTDQNNNGGKFPLSPNKETAVRIQYRKNFVNESEKFTFFWSTDSPFSQRSKSDFSGSTFLLEHEEKEKLLDGLFPFDTQNYTSAEQFMMYHKAMVFLDRDRAHAIMKTSDIGEIRELGKQVTNFDESVWNYFRSKVVYEANKLKFSQNDKLKVALFETKGTTLAAVPSLNDLLWGIGLTQNDPDALKRKLWKGKNLLGEILTKVRIELMGEY